MRTGAVLTLASGALLLAGCTQLLGIEPWGNGGSTGASSSGAGSGGIGGGCTGGGECLTVPLSWRGPAALTVPGGGCGGAFAHRVARGKTDVAGAPAVCGCTCKPAHGEVCSSATLGVFSDPSCTPASGASLDLQSTCASGLSGKPLSAQSISVTAAAPSAGQCDGDATVDQPTPTFDERSLCQPEAAGSSCGDAGACIPVPDGALMPRLCVWVAGHADSCPGDFTERFDLYRGEVVDTRAAARRAPAAPPTEAASPPRSPTATAPAEPQRIRCRPSKAASSSGAPGSPRPAPPMR